VNTVKKKRQINAMANSNRTETTPEKVSDVSFANSDRVWDSPHGLDRLWARQEAHVVKRVVGLVL
jgi:hypothetical protein